VSDELQRAQQRANDLEMHRDSWRDTAKRWRALAIERRQQVKTAEKDASAAFIEARKANAQVDALKQELASEKRANERLTSQLETVEKGRTKAQQEKRDLERELETWRDTGQKGLNNAQHAMTLATQVLAALRTIGMSLRLPDAGKTINPPNILKEIDAKSAIGSPTLNRYVADITGEISRILAPKERT